MSAMHHDVALIVDFGSQVTQLIARRVREAGVYCEIHPFSKAAEAFGRLKPQAVIFSGGPASAPEGASPRAPDSILKSGVPILAICYGQQSLCLQLGGQVAGGHPAEFGRAEVEIVEDCALFDGVWKKGGRYSVWMSHGDRVTRLPAGFRVYAVSENAPYAVAADEKRRYYTTMFHPEVAHTPDGTKLIANFLHKIAGLKGDWTMAAFRAEAILRIRAQVGKGRVICGLSGGVDSAVAAVLIHEAIGDQLVCVFVDHGLLRHGEADQVVSLFRGHYNIPLVHLDASDRMTKLQDKIALVTGAGLGLGGAIAQAMAREGANLVICDIDREALAQTRAAIEAAGRQCLALRCDVSDREAVDAMFAQAAERFGTVDILVNNAARIPSGSKEDLGRRNRHYAYVTTPMPRQSLGIVTSLTDDDWLKWWGVNMHGVFYCTRAALRLMDPRRSGKIINISSIAGLGTGSTHSPGYSATKAGVISLTKTTAMDVAGA